VRRQAVEGSGQQASDGRLFVKLDGRGARATPAHRDADHEEAKTQEGQVGRRIHENVAATQTDSREEKDPVDDEADGPKRPRRRPSRPWIPRPRIGGSRPAGATSRGNVDGDEPSELRVRIKPLKGEPQERHPPENGGPAERGRSR
jgi:hypothetical protein